MRISNPRTVKFRERESIWCSTSMTSHDPATKPENHIASLSTLHPTMLDLIALKYATQEGERSPVDQGEPEADDPHAGEVLGFEPLTEDGGAEQNSTTGIRKVTSSTLVAPAVARTRK